MLSTLREYLPFYRRNLHVALPVMLTGLGNALIGLCDSMMVGHYGTTDLAAVSMANSIFFTAMVFAMGALMAVTPLVGQVYVQGKHDEVARLLRAGLYYALILSGLMMVLLLGMLPFLGHIGQDPVVVEAARPYYVLVVVSVLPFLLFHLEKQFLEGLGNTMVAMIITIVVNLLNILLNYLFIFGHCGLPAMGATGAALASLIARCIMPLAYLWAIRYKPEWKQYLSISSGKRGAGCRWQAAKRLRATPRSSRTTAGSALARYENANGTRRSRLRQLFETGMPMGIQQTLEIFAFTFSFIMVGWISKEALAAHQITNNISDLTFLVSMGVGAAATIRVSHQYGLGDKRAVRMAANASVHLALAWGVICCIAIIMLRQYIPLCFTTDPAVLPLAEQLLVLCGIFQISDALQCVGGAMLRGVTDVRWPMVIALVSYILIALPLGYVLTFTMKWGVQGMWTAFIAGLTIAAILLHWRWQRIHNK